MKTKNYEWDKKTGIIGGDKNLSSDEVLDIIVNNPIFQEDLRIIGNLGRKSSGGKNVRN